MGPRVLLVGGGMTGAVLGAILKKARSQLHLETWDKARGAGGRMSTSRSPADSSCTVDLGAQYITALPQYLQSHSEFYHTLLSSKVLEPLASKVEGMRNFPEGTQHFVSPGGSSSLVKHFLAESGHQVSFEQHVSQVLLQEDHTWLVRTQGGKEEVFDALVLTMPVPQILQQPGHLKQLIASNSKLEEDLKSVTYSSRYALGLFFSQAHALPPGSWDAKYLSDHDTFRFVSIDNQKRNRDELPTSVVFHTSVDFGQKHVELTIEEVRPILMTKVKELFPDWPEPAAVKCQKWRYSQVLNSFPSSPGCIVLQEKPLLLAAGDGFSHSNFDGCVESALAASKALAKYLPAN